MNGNEPLLLYTGGNADYTLLSSPVGGASCFLAIPGRQRIGRSPAGNEADMTGIESQMKTRGGISARVEKKGDIFQAFARLIPAPGYRQPRNLVVIGQGESVEARPFNQSIQLKPYEYAFVPVDAEAEQHLGNLLESIKGLPGDLRAAVLQSIANAGVLDSLRNVSPAPLVAEGPGRFSIWIAAAAVVGLLCGAGGYAAMSHRTPKPAETKVRQANTSPAPALTPAAIELATPLERLETAMANSKDNAVIALKEAALNQADSGARREAEAWMVLKLALYRASKEKGIDAKSALQSNETAKAAFDRVGNFGFDLYSAIAAVACAQAPGAAIVTPDRCAQVNEKDALKGLASLADIPPPASKPAAPPAAGVQKSTGRP